MTNEEWLKRDERALASVLPRCTDIVAMRGLGSYVWDVEYNKYLDFTSGIGVTATGHCHPKVVEAIQLQANTLIHTSVTMHNRPTIRLAERLGSLTPIAEPQVFFCNSGAEAVDGSLKLARIITGKPGVLRFHRAFHGRTLAATALTTAKEKYWKSYGNILSDVFGFYYGQNLNWWSDGIGCVIVEPVLGEGGYIVPPEGWLQSLRELCDEHGALLIFDEVQTGFRTGFPFAAETFGVTPDVILFAKSIASGLPLGGIISSRSVLDQWETGKHGSTFGGNPVACAAALATLGILDPLYERVRWQGKAMLYRLAPYNARGIGYMIGIPLANKEQADSVKQRCQDNGLLVLSCGPEDDVIRLIPPLTATDDELELGLSILEEAINYES